MTTNVFDRDRRLSPYLSPREAWALAIGTSVGWGSMVVTTNTYLAQAGLLGSLLGLAGGALIMLIMSRNYHYMTNSIPDAGGAYAFARETFGHDHGFLSAWFLALTYIAMLWANATALPLFAEYFLGDVFHFGFHYSVFGYEIYLGEALLSIAAIALTALLCSRSRRSTSRAMVGMSVLFIACILICFVGVMLRRDAVAFPSQPLFVPGRSPWMQVLRIVSISPWAYIGFENISHSAEEFRFPHRKTFRLLVAAVLIALALYAAILLISVSAWPGNYGSWLEYVQDSGTIPGIKGLPVFFATGHYLGNAGTALLMAALLALIFTSLIGNTIALSRLFLSMARDEILPQRLTVLNEKGIPYRAVWLIALVSLPIPFLGRAAIGWIVDVTTIGATLLFGFVSASTWKMARSRGDQLYRCTGLIGLMLMVGLGLYLLLFNLLSANSLEAETYFLFTLWSVFGFLFFLTLLRRDYTRKFGRSTVVWIALLLLVLFTSLIWMSQSYMASSRQAMEAVRLHYLGPDAPLSDMDEQMIQIQMGVLRQANVRSMLVVILLFCVSLGIHVLLQSKHAALEREKMRAEEGSRAKSQFLFNMSHDIRTPMNAIVGFTHLARQPDVTDAEKNAYLDKIEASGQQLLGIINDVLDMSRIENGKLDLTPAPMDLEQVFAEAKDLFAHQMREKGVAFDLVCDVRHPWVMCDRNRFNRVLLNLLSNAYKFTPSGGTVTVRMSERANCEYELIVKDTGIGMNADFVEHVFTPFERERTSTVSGIQGTGLGLSITRSIVEMMGGDIRVDSRPNEGTQFTVTLPLPAAEPPAQAAAEEGETSAVDFSTMRLLLVEDNPVNMEIAKMILSQSGFLLDTAEDGRAAVDIISGSQPGDYDCILMDIQMPVMNGYEATRAIRALPDPALSNIPIVAMTANVFQEDVQAARNAGMDGHIAKPLNVENMLRTLSRVLSKQTIES